uniref:Uncharacterized protein n=1 Tax=Arundo donax TaxID=35708 RepID=A0A0A9E036_ARUDO
MSLTKPGGPTKSRR